MSHPLRLECNRLRVLQHLASVSILRGVFVCRRKAAVRTRRKELSPSHRSSVSEERLSRETAFTSPSSASAMSRSARTRLRSVLGKWSALATCSNRSSSRVLWLRGTAFFLHAHISRNLSRDAASRRRSLYAISYLCRTFSFSPSVTPSPKYMQSVFNSRKADMSKRLSSVVYNAMSSTAAVGRHIQPRLETS